MLSKISSSSVLIDENLMQSALDLHLRVLHFKNENIGS